MVEFAGYAMPVQYQGVLAEHLHCRAQATLFDVSHMGQATLTGAPAAAALERLVPGDLLGLKPGRQRYTLLTNEVGGILDDLMVANPGGEKLFLVVNASRKEIDFTHIAANLPSGVQFHEHDDRALLALQGPAAAAVISHISAEASQIPFMGMAAVTLAGIPWSRAPATPARTDSKSRCPPKAHRPWHSAFWTNRRSFPPAWAHAIRCDWKRDYAFTATTSTS